MEEFIICWSLQLYLGYRVKVSAPGVAHPVLAMNEMVWDTMSPLYQVSCSSLFCLFLYIRQTDWLYRTLVLR